MDTENRYIFINIHYITRVWLIIGENQYGYIARFLGEVGILSSSIDVIIGHNLPSMITFNKKYYELQTSKQHYGY